MWVILGLHAFRAWGARYCNYSTSQNPHLNSNSDIVPVGFVRFGDLLGWCICFARGRVAMAHPGLHQNALQKLKRHFLLRICGLGLGCRVVGFRFGVSGFGPYTPNSKTLYCQCWFCIELMEGRLALWVGFSCYVAAMSETDDTPRNMVSLEAGCFPFGLIRVLGSLTVWVPS